jgi:hypothetical protein
MEKQQRSRAGLSTLNGSTHAMHRAPFAGARAILCRPMASRVFLPIAVVLSLGMLSPAARAYVHLGGKWPTSDGPVEYFISAAGVDDITDDTDEQAVQYAFRSWECVLCSDVQFRFMGHGPNEAANDGKSAVFWLEDEQTWIEQTGSGVDATLGIAMHYEGETYAESDIAFNGTHTWSSNEAVSATDIESVAVHEAGHFAGLGHSCTDDLEADCLSPEDSVMNPTYPGGLLRDPRADDQDGLCALYNKPKTECQGKKRLKERCERDCDCEDGLYCIPDGEGRMCSRSCDSNNASCPKGTGCVLGAESGGSQGFCLRNPESSKKSDGSVCSREQECDSGRCERHSVIGKLICTRACNGPEQCQPGFTCLEGACLLPSAGQGVPCLQDEPERRGWFAACGCQASAEGAGPGVILLTWVLWVGGRRGRHRSAGPPQEACKWGADVEDGPG